MRNNLLVILCTISFRTRYSTVKGPNLRFRFEVWNTILQDHQLFIHRILFFKHFRMCCPNGTVEALYLLYRLSTSVVVVGPWQFTPPSLKRKGNARWALLASLSLRLTGCQDFEFVCCKGRPIIRTDIALFKSPSIPLAVHYTRPYVILSLSQPYNIVPIIGLPVIFITAPLLV